MMYVNMWINKYIYCTLPRNTNSDHKQDHNEKHNKLGREMA